MTAAIETEVKDAQAGARVKTWIEAALEANPNQIFELNPDDPGELLVHADRNSRPTPPIGDKSLKDLITDIERMGQNQVPALATLNVDGVADLYAGFKRARSVQTLRKAGSSILLRVIITAGVQDEVEAYVRSVSENSQREDMNLMEKCGSLIHLMKSCGKSMKEAAQICRLSMGAASVIARFDMLPENAKKAIAQGKCSYNSGVLFVGMLPKREEILADESGEVLAAAQAKIMKMVDKELSAGGKVSTKNVDAATRKEGADGKAANKKQRRPSQMVSELDQEIEGPANKAIVSTLKAIKVWINGGTTAALLKKLEG